MYGVVLAGGASRRFGADKTHIQVDGLTLLERSKRALEPVCDVVRVIRATDDLRPGRGPLAAIETALTWADGPVLVVACDLPGLSPELIRVLAEWNPAALVVVPVVGGRRHALCSRWSQAALPAVTAALDAGEGSVQRVLDRLGAEEVDEAALVAAGIDATVALWNVNRPADLEEFKAAR